MKVKCKGCGEVSDYEDTNCRCVANQARVAITLPIDMVADIDGDDINIHRASVDGEPLPQDILRYIETECVDEIKDQI